MIVERISGVDIIKDKREEHEYIYKIFNYNNIHYLIFFLRHKHLFNIDLDYLNVHLTPILMRRIMDEDIVCDK